MRRRAVASLAASVAVLAACAPAPREPLPITPPSEVRSAPVARVPIMPEPSAPAARPSPPGAGIAPAPAAATGASPASTPVTAIDPAALPPGAVYACASGSGTDRKLTAIQFEPKVGELCRRHPEMGPCQYERNLCRRSGGRVYAADGREITMATEAEYDRKVMRVRFRAN